MAAYPPSAARLCRVGRNIIKKERPRTFPQWKTSSGEELLNVFDTNAKVLVFQYNCMTAQEWSDLRYDMRQNNAAVRIFPNKISSVFLERSVYANIAPLFRSETAIAFGGADLDTAFVLKLFQRHMKVELVGGMLDRTLMNKQHIADYAKLPSLEESHAQLAHLLGQPAQKLAALLDTNQSNLSMSLEQLVKQQSENL